MSGYNYQPNNHQYPQGEGDYRPSGGLADSYRNQGPAGEQQDQQYPPPSYQNDSQGYPPQHGDPNDGERGVMGALAGGAAGAYGGHKIGGKATGHSKTSAIVGALAGAFTGHKMQDAAEDWKDERDEKKEEKKRRDEEHDYDHSHRRRHSRSNSRSSSRSSHHRRHDSGSGPRGGNYAGNFTSSSTDIHLDAHGDYNLRASCRQGDRSYRSSTISLNNLLENDHGSFRWVTAGNYSNDGPRSVTVRQGDTLRSIASSFGCSFEEIAGRNGISNPDMIYPGQVLQIPDAGGNRRGRGNFSESARDVRLVDDGRRLEAELRGDGGEWVRSSIILDERIGNDNGTLRLI